jgi:hypothetical protein
MVIKKRSPLSEPTPNGPAPLRFCEPFTPRGVKGLELPGKSLAVHGRHRDVNDQNIRLQLRDACKTSFSTNASRTVVSGLAGDEGIRRHLSAWSHCASICSAAISRLQLINAFSRPLPVRVSVKSRPFTVPSVRESTSELT